MLLTIDAKTNQFKVKFLNPAGESKPYIEMLLSDGMIRKKERKKEKKKKRKKEK